MNIRSLHLSLTLLGSAAVTRAADIPAELKGRLVALRGKSTLPYNAPELAQTKYFALYYGAGWCGPCHQFTPKLIAFYQEMKPKYPGAFEVVFISKDESANEMQKYMAELAMPWPALRFSAVKGDRALNKYCGPPSPVSCSSTTKVKCSPTALPGKITSAPTR